MPMRASEMTAKADNGIMCENLRRLYIGALEQMVAEYRDNEWMAEGEDQADEPSVKNAAGCH